MSLDDYTMIGPVAIQGMEGCQDPRCRRAPGASGCMGYHCPYCGAACSMMGHRCDAANAVLGEAERIAKEGL